MSLQKYEGKKTKLGLIVKVQHNTDCMVQSLHQDFLYKQKGRGGGRQLIARRIVKLMSTLLKMAYILRDYGVQLFTIIFIFQFLKFDILRVPSIFTTIPVITV